MFVEYLLRVLDIVVDFGDIVRNKRERGFCFCGLYIVEGDSR